MLIPISITQSKDIVAETEVEKVEFETLRSE